MNCGKSIRMKIVCGLLRKSSKKRKKKKRKGKLQYFVKWQGFDDSFSRWIDASEVKDTTS